LGHFEGELPPWRLLTLLVSVVMSGKRGRSFPRSDESRTTAKHAFQPPEKDGTVSQSRADRWENANKQMHATAPAAARGQKREASSPQRSKALKEGSRSVSPLPSKPAPVIAPPPQPQQPMAREKLDLKQVAPPSELEGHWFQYEPLNPQPGRHGPHDIEPVRLGMSHPPQNQKVRKDLLAYLYARKVRVPSRSTLKKRPDNSASDPSLHQSSTLRHSSSQSPEKTLLPRGAQAATRKNRPSGLPLLGEQSIQAEVHRHSELLRTNSRHLGFELAKKDVKDLAELAIYHNKMLRRHVHVPTSKQAPSPVQQLRALKQQCLLEQEKDDERQRLVRKQEAPGLTNQSTRPMPMLQHQESGPLSTAGGHASPSRLRRIAHQLTTSSPGPCRLQLMARASGVNVITGGSRLQAAE